MPDIGTVVGSIHPPGAPLIMVATNSVYTVRLNPASLIIVLPVHVAVRLEFVSVGPPVR